MKKLYSSFSLSLLLLVVPQFLVAQSTDVWADYIYPLLNTKCAGSGCHGGSRLDFDVTQTSDSLYTQLINGIPKNPYAKDSVNNVYVKPGDPSKSFLLRKIISSIDSSFALALTKPQEGDDMPQNRPSLAADSIETIRQWIYAGAPKTGSGNASISNAGYVQPNVYKSYYAGNALPRMQTMAPPNEGEGFQIHLGPIFMSPGEENEFWHKIDLELDDQIEINRIDVKMNDFSHHFILYKYKPGEEQNKSDGIRYLNPLSPGDAFDGTRDFVLAWQDNYDIPLPSKTAYFWPENTFLDLNYHIKNYDVSKNLATEVYINVYTQPKGTAEKEMKAVLINNPAIFLLPSSSPQTLRDNINLGDVSIWNITSHAHSLAVDYDVFFRNQDGSKGDQIYEGMFDYNAGFNTGVYDWEHPPVRFFEPFLDVSSYRGIVHEATYINNTGQLKTFGFTTNDEMMIVYLNYVENSPDSSQTGVLTNAENNNFQFSVFPNPFQDLTNIRYNLTEKTDVKLEVYNMIGELVGTLVNEEQSGGTYNIGLNPSKAGFPNGTYLIKLSLDGQQMTKKVMHFN